VLHCSSADGTVGVDVEPALDAEGVEDVARIAVEGDEALSGLEVAGANGACGLFFVQLFVVFYLF